MKKNLVIVSILMALITGCDKTVDPDLLPLAGQEYWRGSELPPMTIYNIEVIQFESDTLLSSYTRYYYRDTMVITGKAYYLYTYNRDIQTIVGRSANNDYFLYFKREGDSLRYFHDSTWTRPVRPAYHRVN